MIYGGDAAIFFGSLLCIILWNDFEFINLITNYANEGSDIQNKFVVLDYALAALGNFSL